MIFDVIKVRKKLNIPLPKNKNILLVFEKNNCFIFTFFT